MTKLLSEREAIDRLEKLAQRWPNSLWLFSANGELCVMRNKPDGTRAMKTQGSVDEDFVVAVIDIPNDGGDW